MTQQRNQVYVSLSQRERKHVLRCDANKRNRRETFSRHAFFPMIHRHLLWSPYQFYLTQKPTATVERIFLSHTICSQSNRFLEWHRFWSIYRMSWVFLSACFWRVTPCDARIVAHTHRPCRHHFMCRNTAIRPSPRVNAWPPSLFGTIGVNIQWASLVNYPLLSSVSIIDVMWCLDCHHASNRSSLTPSITLAKTAMIVCVIWLRRQSLTCHNGTILFNRSWTN